MHGDIGTAIGERFEIRRTEVVGPKVGSELIINGALAIALALIGIGVYVWFRFEWQFALGACLSLTHDVISPSKFLKQEYFDSFCHL